MNLFQHMKGAFHNMIKVLAPEQITERSVLGRKKYVIDNITRLKIELPQNHSVLSMEKYFEDEDSEVISYERKKK